MSKNSSCTATILDKKAIFLTQILTTGLGYSGMIAGMGERLKKLRLRQKLTQNVVAQLIGVTRATISGYEHDVSQPPADVLIKLASVYHCTVDYILGVSKDGSFVVTASTPEKQEKIYQIFSLIEKE